MGKAVLSAGEMRRMIHAEGVVNAYHSRTSGNAAEWVKENPEMNEMLYEAQKLAEHDG